MELGVSHVQNLSSLTPTVDNIFDKYKNLVPIRSLSDHDSIIGVEMVNGYYSIRRANSSAFGNYK